MRILPLDSWISDQQHPLIIAGPCSADSQEQLLATAKQLAQNKDVKIFRAGIWKPRTRPNNFEGVGEIGLPWLKKVKEQTDLLTATEVASPYHVQKALEHNIDILWIGARTSANPFSVQEIAQALRGIDIPVMIKNPINADLSLWLGAIERVANAGIDKIIAIHRGFSSYESNKYRNPPMWQLPIELKRRLPELPIICDPSHICGNTRYIPTICQKAMDLDMNGLMIECHTKPQEALSDTIQHLAPQELKEMLDGLTIRQESVNQQDFEQLLEELRGRIDRLDHEMLDTLMTRMQVVEKIAEAKIENGVTALQLSRLEEMILDRVKKGEKLNLSKHFVEELFKQIHTESVRKQTKIMSKV